MSIPRIESMWDLLSDNSVAVPLETTQDDLMCIICKKLLIDAFVSSICGCQYCHKCIREYINNEDKHCPGSNDDCKVEFITLGGNVVRHARLNRSISKLKVNCPNQSCLCNIELIEMMEHLRLCKKQAIDCPYVAIGCNRVDRDTIESHMNNETLTHSELLIELIRNLRNEFSVLREESEKMKIEIYDLREESRINKNKIGMLEEDLRNVRNEMEERVNEEIRIKEDARMGRVALATLVTNLRKDIDDGFGQSKLEMTSLSKISRHTEERIASLEEKLSVVRKEGEIKLNEILLTAEREISDQRQQVDAAKIEKENLSKMVASMTSDMDGIKKWMQACDDDRGRKIIVAGDFVWKIDNFSEKVNAKIYSEPFYSNNYKFCLFLNINKSRGSVYLCCYLMKGDNDDRVSWPMKRAVTIAIVDQITKNTYKWDTKQYDNFKGNITAFDKPQKDRNDFPIGLFLSFINYSSVKDNPSVVVNNTLVVSFTLGDK